MKKFFVLLLVVVFSFVSCNFQLPKSVSIKTKADYDFTVAKIDEDFSKYFSFKTIFDGISSETMKPYDYWPNKKGDVQKFLLSIPIGVIPIDFSSYLDRLDITEMANNMSFSQEIKVPEIKPVEVEHEIKVEGPYQGFPPNIPLPETNVPDINVKFEMTTGDSFATCEVKEGKLTLEFIPEGWTNPDIKWNISTTGGIEIPASKWTSDGKGKCVADLAGATLKNEDTDMVINLTVSADSADLNKKCLVKGTCVIDEIETVKVKLPEGTETSIDEEKELVINDVLKSITLGNSKFEFKYWNTLPEGNNLELTCKSDFLGIAEKKETLEGATPKSDKKTISYEASNDAETGKTISCINGTLDEKFDFKAKFNFGEEDGYVTAKNVRPGETYEIGVDVNVVFDWKAVTVDLGSSGLGMSSSDPIDTGIDMSSIMSGLKGEIGGDTKSNLFDNITFPEIPLYVYCQIPAIEVFEGAKFTGNVSIGSISEGDYTEKGKLFEGEIKSTNLPNLVIEDNTVTSDISNKEKYPCSAEILDLADTVGLNDSASGSLAILCEDISVKGANGTGEVTITKAELDALKAKEKKDTNCNIEIQAIVVLPLEFKVGKNGSEDEYYLDLMSFVGKDSGGNDDLFGRSEALSDDTITSYLDVIKEARISFANPTLPFRCKADSESTNLSSLGLVIDLGLDGANDDESISPNETDVKTFVFNSGKPLRITGTEVKKMLETYPLKTSVVLAFPKGTFSILRNTKFGATINVGLSTDGTIPLSELKGGN